MYNESVSGPNRVKVTSVPQGGINIFYQEIDAVVKPNNGVWKNFSDTVGSEVKIRAKNLEERIKKTA